MASNSLMRKQVKQFVDEADEKTLRIIYNLFETQRDDWWNVISEEHKSAINEAISEANRGKVIPHSEMEKKYRKWLKK